MNFPTTLVALLAGATVYRSVWRTANRTGISLYRPLDTAGLFLRDENTGAETIWTPTVEDLLASDWVIVGA